MSTIVIPVIFALLAALWFMAAALTRRMSRPPTRLALFGGVLAVLMVIALAVVVIRKMPITAAVAIPLFVTTILQFGLLIAMVSRLLSGRLHQRTFTFGVLVIIAAILIGVVLMFQPLTSAVFGIGFDFVLIALLAFNVWNHIAPRQRQQ